MSNPVTSEAAIAYKNLERRLPLVKPFLFELADNVISAAEDARWNVLIGDDVSGRLPAYFMRRVLGQAGFELPMHYVAGSKRLHDHLNSQAYDERLTHIHTSIGARTLRPLIITESIGTRATLNFLEEKLAPMSSAIESACLVAKFPELSATYNGGVGKEASRTVFYTFESDSLATPKRRAVATLRRLIPQAIKNHAPAEVKQIGSWPSNELLGLHIDKQASYPICERTGSNPYTSLAYSLMDDLAAEYSFADQPAFETKVLSAT
jgi:hypothetical protein